MLTPPHTSSCCITHCHLYCWFGASARPSSSASLRVSSVATATIPWDLSGVNKHIHFSLSLEALPHSGREQPPPLCFPEKQGSCPGLSASEAPVVRRAFLENHLCPTLWAVTSQGYQGSLHPHLVPGGFQLLEKHPWRFPLSLSRV